MLQGRGYRTDWILSLLKAALALSACESGVCLSSVLFPAEMGSPAPSISVSAATSVSGKGAMGTEISSGCEIPAAAGAWREEIYTFPINQIILGAAKAEPKPEGSGFCLRSSRRCRLGGRDCPDPPGGSGSAAPALPSPRCWAGPGVVERGSALAASSSRGAVQVQRRGDALHLRAAFLRETHPESEQPVVRQQGNLVSFERPPEHALHSARRAGSAGDAGTSVGRDGAAERRLSGCRCGRRGEGGGEGSGAAAWKRGGLRYQPAVSPLRAPGSGSGRCHVLHLTLGKLKALLRPRPLPGGRDGLKNPLLDFFL